VQPCSRLDPDSLDIDAELLHARKQHIAAEMRAWELVQALKGALGGAPHWRSEAQGLLRQIAAGHVPEPRA
jgi:hypothetical protein